MNQRLDRDSWERRWAEVIRDHPDKVASRPPSAHLVGEFDGAEPGRALDAGCGHGADAMWLAAAGWRVTAVDYSAAALDLGRSLAETMGVGDRIEWVEGDLGTWTPEPGRYDLVSCLYVHSEGPVGELVERLGRGVAKGGSLFLVGHLPVDPATGEPTMAAGQNQVSVEKALEALDEAEWHIALAEERVRAHGVTGVDAVIRGTRR